MQTGPHPEVSHYAYRVMWSAEDDEFVATCAEFSSLSWLAFSQVEALQGLQDLLRDVIVDMAEQGEQVPPDQRDRAQLPDRPGGVGEALTADSFATSAPQRARGTGALGAVAPRRVQRLTPCAEYGGVEATRRPRCAASGVDQPQKRDGSKATPWQAR